MPPTNWDAELDQEVRRLIGPEDEFDDEANGDPDSFLGDDDESGVDDGPDEPEPLVVDDAGFDDAEGAEDDEDCFEEAEEDE